MPAKTKALRAGRISCQRLVYVSSSIDADANGHIQWRELFWRTMKLAALQKQDVVGSCRRSDETIPGDVKSRALDPSITDAVCILTTRYLTENTDTREGPSTGELARFVDRLKEQRNPATASEVPLLVFLALVDPLRWDYKVRQVRLDDAMMRRLKDTQFSWPATIAETYVATNEIAKAVDLIVDEIEKSNAA